MENLSDKENNPFKPTRRDVLIGAAALVGGIFLEPSLKSTFERPQTISALEPGNGEAQPNLAINWLPDTVERWKDTIEEISRKYGLDPDLTAIIMTVESGGDPRANSGLAGGLMQITKPTAIDIAEKYLKEPRQKYDFTNPNTLKKIQNDPTTSIEFGLAYLKYLVDTFGDPDQGPSWDKTVELVAAGYNGGPGWAEKLRDQGIHYVELNNSETYLYVRHVVTMWVERHMDKSFGLRDWKVAGGQRLIDNAKKYRKK